MDSIFLKNITLDGKQVDILVKEGKIAEISFADAQDDKRCAQDDKCFVLDCTGKTAMPGFVNAHTHAAMSLMRGIGEDMVLHDWLDHIWGIESHLDRPFVYSATKVANLEMIKTGTTSFNDMYWHSRMAMKATEEIGLRGLFSYTCLDNFDPEVTARQKDECAAMYEMVKDNLGRQRFAVSIHAVYTVSEPMILWATDFARKCGLRIHIHLSETRKEVEDCKAAHGGLSPVEYFDSLGLLGQDVIAAHSLWLSEKDVEILGRRGVSCVHNINSNLKLASGYKFLCEELKDAGANVCLGTDGCASSNNLDMLEAMKTTAIVEKAWRDDPTALPLGDLLDMDFHTFQIFHPAKIGEFCQAGADDERPQRVAALKHILAQFGHAIWDLDRLDRRACESSFANRCYTLRDFDVNKRLTIIKCIGANGLERIGQ